MYSTIQIITRGGKTVYLNPAMINSIEEDQQGAADSWWVHTMGRTYPLNVGRETALLLARKLGLIGSLARTREPSICNGKPRRIQIDLFTPAESALFGALLAVEEAGAHPLLTEAGVLIQEAREKVADYVESISK